MTWSDLPQVLFELLWPFVFVFAFMVFVKARIRRYKAKRNIEFKHPGWLFVVAAVLSLGIFLLLGFTVMEELTTSLFVKEVLNKEESFLFYMAGMAVFLMLIPFLTAPLVCRFWPNTHTENQRDKT